MRTQIYNISQDQEGIVIYDPNSVDWNSFDWTQGYYLHTLTKTDVLKPYMISYAYYGVVDYEDIILLLNNIDNVFDLIPGTQIYVPVIGALQDFILRNKK